MHVHNLGKGTTGSNDLRRRNFKKVEDRVNPDSSFSSAALTLNSKGKAEGLQKIKKAIKNVSSTALWNWRNFDAKHVAERILLGEKE